MAGTESVYSAAATEALCDDTSLNPALTETDAELSITLVNRSGSITMGQVYDALNAQFATVTANKIPAKGLGEFIIT